MEPHTLIGLVHGTLEPFVRGLKGTLSVAADPYNFLELLAEAPQGWRCVLHWGGDDALVQAPLEGGFCDEVLEIGISCNPGLTAKPEEAMFKKRPGNTPSLLELIARVRAHVRGSTINRPEEDTEGPWHFRGAKPVVLPDGTPLRAYRLTFTLTAAPDPVPALQ